MTPGIAFDTNVLVYAELESDSQKGEIATRAMRLVAPRAIVAAQTLLEFLAVIRRRSPEDLPRALALVDLWRSTLRVAPTTGSIVEQACGLIRDHRLQVWDAVIIAASSAAGGCFLLSEDLQDGLHIGGLTVVDPFKRDMAELLQVIGR
ncbi:MAG: PIN domain-containing protein [Caulobacteraceae bacterium]